MIDINIVKPSIAIIFYICIASQLIFRPLAKADENPNICILAGAGYGIQDDDSAGSFGTAFALKGSYRLLNWIHLGAEGTFHIGTRFGDEQNRVNYYGVEAGAGYVIDRLSICGYLTGGIASVSSQRNEDPSFTTEYYGLGLVADVVLIEWYTISADSRFLVIPEGIQQSDVTGQISTVDFLFLAGARL